YESTQSDEVKLYLRLRGITPPAEHLAMLVQHEIEIHNSALVYLRDDEYFVELFGADFSEDIQGRGPPTHVVRIRGGKVSVVGQDTGAPRAFLGQLSTLADAVRANVLTE